MTDPVSAAGSVSATSPQPQSATGQPPAASPVMVDVSRAGTAPIYIYRVTDTATGRTLVEIPTQREVADPDRPGAKIDSKV